MKKKLLSVIALAMAMTMTTSAFAANIGPRARGTGDVDGDGQITANDVLMILNGLANDNAAADVDGNGLTSTVENNKLDANVAYKTVLQPKTVSENLVFNIYSASGIQGNINILDASKLGASVKAGDKGMEEVNTTSVENLSTNSTIKNAISEAVEAASLKNITVTNQINKIFFKGNGKLSGSDVYLRSENGFAMLAYALRYIVPLDKETASLANKASIEGYTYYDAATASAEDTARYNGLMKVKKILVGNDQKPANTDPTADVNKAPYTAVMSSDDIVNLKEAAFEAVPPTITADEISNTAREILLITDAKYDFSVEYNGNTEALKADTVADSQFVKDIIAIAAYDKTTMADYRNTFGDKLVFSGQNRTSSAEPITAVFQVAETAK